MVVGEWVGAVVKTNSYSAGVPLVIRQWADIERDALGITSPIKAITVSPSRV
jgi:alanine racemase